MISKPSTKQLDILSTLESKLGTLEWFELFDTERVSVLSLEQLLLVLRSANATYRAGYPIIDDQTYDNVFLTELKNRDAKHPYLSSIEPEVMVDSKTVPLPQKMLSTDKAYTFEAIAKWVERVLKVAKNKQIQVNQIEFRVTPKLDGYAAFDDGKVLYTRGDGSRGQDISRAFTKGLKVAGSGQRGLGPGEIVISKSYFEEQLSLHFENSRNIQAAIIAEKKVDPLIQQAIDDGACVFYPFSDLVDWRGEAEELLEHFESICEQIWNSLDYDIDGIIVETTREEVKQEMGATRHHHRWQIAFKVNEESAEVEVLSVTPQTSRTGRISPVAELQPTRLSGATISRATVHHYNMVKSNGVGPGAVVELVRSGLVIPKIERVIKKVSPQIPIDCPSCGAKLLWESDHLICPNKTECPAQTENTLVHFFRTLGNVDGFGPKVIEKLSANGVKAIHDIYLLQQEDFMGFGFGEKTSGNLINQLAASKNLEIEDWRFLAAFGVTRLGFGNCEKLLEHHFLVDLFNLTVEQMVEIDGFAEISAEAIHQGLRNIKDEFFKVYQLGFNLSITKASQALTSKQSPIVEKLIVFTGTMQQGSRADMEKQAKALGAKVGKSVSSKTNLLITGDKVGSNKISAAQAKGVKVLTEQEYFDLIG
jgi:DNA ligase (NAD+)